MYLFKKKVLYSALMLVLGVTMLSTQAFAQQKQQSKDGATLSGKVVDASSQQAVNGVDVQIQKLDKKATTDKKGAYSFDSLKPGSYTVTVKADGYKTWSKKVAITKGSKTLDIKLQPSMGQ